MMLDEFRFLGSDAQRVGRTSPLPEVRRDTVEVSGDRTVSALRFDPAHPQEYVFLHGMGLNAHGFDPVILALGAPALALDLPGHGQSAWREDANYRPDLLAHDVVEALGQLAPAPFVLVGHSLSGLTAAIAAPALADRLRGLAILDNAQTVAGSGPPTSRTWMPNRWRAWVRISPSLPFGRRLRRSRPRANVTRR